MGGWLASAVWNTDITVGTGFNTRHTQRKYFKILSFGCFFQFFCLGNYVIDNEDIAKYPKGITLQQTK